MASVDSISTNTNSINATQAFAPKTDAEHFHNLLMGTLQVFKGSESALVPQEYAGKAMQGTLVEDTAKRLNKAEVAIEELNWEIKKATQALPTDGNSGSSVMQAVTDLKYKSTTYFLNIMRAESGFSGLAEETESLTKKRG